MVFKIWIYMVKLRRCKTRFCTIQNSK